MTTFWTTCCRDDWRWDDRAEAEEAAIAEAEAAAANDEETAQDTAAALASDDAEGAPSDEDDATVTILPTNALVTNPGRAPQSLPETGKKAGKEVNPHV